MYTSRCGCIHPLRISAMDVSTLMMSYLKKHLQQHKTLQATVGLLEWHCVVTQANLMSNLTKLNEFSWFIGISYTKYILLFHTNTRGIEPYHCCIVSSGGRMHSMCFVLTVLIAGKLLSIWMFETINIQIWMSLSDLRYFENVKIFLEKKSTEIKTSQLFCYWELGAHLWRAIRSALKRSNLSISRHFCENLVDWETTPICPRFE